ncbi:hypothetical protein ACF0H5_010584 [Mactra antiquata]
MDEGVAIIGIGCRVPGADNIEEFWRVLEKGENHVVDIPAERWNNEYYYSETGEAGKSFVKKAGLLKGHDEFDYEFFKISKGEAETIDPQQRLVLECAHMAFEDGGITRDRLNGSNTGVFVGAMNDDYKGLSNNDHDEETNYSATGMSSTYISARISHAYNLHGPCTVVDTACSSSMMAIHLGCQSIKTGESTMAVCGGANSILEPDQFIVLSKAGMLSRSGQCQTFCDTADGYARSEGCGIVILKSYKQAINDGDKIWGLIRTGTNQDGRTALSVAAPSSEQQLELLKRMYQRYDVDPTALQYIEAHGTGTPVGDPVETTALGQFISSFRISSSKGLDQFYDSSAKSTIVSDMSGSTSGKEKIIRIGSVKTNIGHLESAAGVVSLIKVLLMMDHGQFVPSLHIKKDMSNLNKNIKLKEHGISISTDLSEWARNENGERLGCINSFGFGGSNVHAIVTQPRQEQSHNGRTVNAMKVINMSAQNKQSLYHMLNNLVKSLDTKRFNLEDIAYTSILKRDIHSYRLLVYGENDQEIQEQIMSKLKNIEHLESVKQCHVVFMFCGVGTAWSGMCRHMMEKVEVFKSTIEIIDELLAPLTGWSISELFSKDTKYVDPLVNHIAIFCSQIALFKTWEYYGVRPDVIIGQSVGEVAAAYASGALSLNEAIEVIYKRSAALAKFTGGGMLVIGNIPIEILEKACRPYEDELNIAVYNSPVSCTVSGSGHALDGLKQDLEAMKGEYPDLFVKPLVSQCAYHSRFIDKCLNEFSDSFSNVTPKPCTITHYSTVTGGIATDGDFQTVEYWVKNIRNPVKLMTAVQKSTVNDKVNVILEIGPRPILGAHLKNIIPVKTSMSISSMNKDDTISCFYRSVEKLYSTGVDVSLRKFAVFGNIVQIPRYVFNKTKLLHIPSKRALSLRGIEHSGNGHMFVRQIQGETLKYHLAVDQETTPFVYEHFIFGRHLVPGSFYVEAAFEIGSLSSTWNFSEMCVHVEFLKSVTPEIKGRKVLDVIESVGANAQGYREWLVCNQNAYACKISVKARHKSTPKIQDISMIKSRCQTHRTKEESYECLKSMHFTYGKNLQLMHQTWSSTNECLTEFILPDVILNQRKWTHLHPSALDGLFQTFGVLNIGSAGQTFLPARIDSVVLNRPLEKRMFGYAKHVRSSSNGKYFDAMFLTPNGEVIAEIKDFFLKHVSSEKDTNVSLGYQLIWTESSLPQNAATDEFTDSGNVLVIGDKHFYDKYRVKMNSKISFIGWNDDTDILFDNYRFIVVAALDSVDDTMHCDNVNVYNQFANHFHFMKSLIEGANKKSFSGSIYIVTENAVTQSAKSNEEIKVNGAGLWGMVRSALLEYPYVKMHLVDIELNRENFMVFEKLTRVKSAQSFECMIRNGKTFYSEMVTLDISETSDTIKSSSSNSEDMILKSFESNAVETPYFTIKEYSALKGTNNLFCEIDLESICLHDASLYPLTFDDREDECLDINDNPSNGHAVICIEGVGTNHESKSRMGFCWPTETCNRVSIPTSCIFDINEMGYVPGLMSVSLLLHNIAQKCTKYRKVHIITDENIPLVRQMFSQCECIIQNYDSIEVKQDTCKANVLVMLTNFSRKFINSYLAENSQLECIITYEPFITRATAVSVGRDEPLIDLKILNTEDVFKTTNLEETVPIVANQLQKMAFEIKANMRNNLRNTKPKCRRILHLPYTSLGIRNNEGENAAIPLHVSEHNLFRKNCCYVVIGGLSGLGWELLVYMAEMGAGYIATVHRRNPSIEQLKKISDAEEKLNCKIIPCIADVAKLDELNDAFMNLRKCLGHEVDVKGVLHGGGVLDDCLLENMSRQSIKKVLLPKVLGTLNLHEVTKRMNLDFFIMHSSIVSVTGNHGQCNYAAGNSFMDAFVLYRRSQGMCAQSINWSALSVGMAAESQQALQLKTKGFKFLTIEEIRHCFLFTIKSKYAQIIFGKFDWGKLKDDLLTKRNSRKYSSLTGVHSTSDLQISRSRSFELTSFLQKSPSNRLAIVREIILSAVQDVFVCSNIELSASLVFGSLGIDSMASMHFIDYIRQSTGVEIPMSILFADTTTLGSLCDMLMEKIEERRNISSSSEKNMSVHEKQLSEYLLGVVPFTQVSLLNDFLDNRFTKNIMRQVDIEVIGDKVQSVEDWKEIFNHLLEIEPDLRRIFLVDKKPFESCLMEDVTMPIEEVSFDSIGHSDVSDDRDFICMDITKDIPISIKIAIAGDRTRLRFFIHGLLGDLPAVTMIFQQFAKVATTYASGRPLPEPRPCEICPADSFRKAFIPRANTLQMFWSSIDWNDVQPFTLGTSLTNVLNEKYWTEISVCVPKDIAKTVIESKHNSIYNFITSAYMAILHKETHKEFIPLATYVDMRGHVHDLQNSIISCSNGVPVLGDFRKLGKVADFIEANSGLLSSMTQHSAYPYDLILREMKSEELRTEIGRHRIIMEDFTAINQIMTFENSIVNYKMFFKRHVYETSLHVIYDKQTHGINLEFGYNSSVVNEDVAEKILRNLVTIIHDFKERPDASMSDILDGLDDVNRRENLPICYKHKPM